MFQQSSKIILSTFLVLFLTQACHAELMCYVCENCAKINAQTPLLACNEDYFNSAGTTAATTVEPTMTSAATSEETTKEMPTSSSSTTVDPPTTTEESSSSTASEQSTESTERPIPTPPTPPTAGPVVTTTAVPTPPFEDLQARSALNATNLLVNNTNDAVTTTAATPTTTAAAAVTTTTNRTYTASTEFRLRQVRSLVDTDVTYHCYTVQKDVNNTIITERGCSRVGTMESVCPQLEKMNAGIKLANCDPCTMNKCNGSGALAVSALTMIFASVACFLGRN